MPPLARTNRPARLARASVNAPARVAEQLALEQRLGQRRAVDRDERPARAPPLLVQRARDQLLAGAALARDQHRRVGGRGAQQGVVHAPHRRAAADERRAGQAGLVGIAGRVGGQAQAPHLGAQAVIAHRARQRQSDRLDLERLGHEVVGAGADRRDRGLQAAERGDHHDRRVGAVGRDPRRDVQARDPRHVQIDDDRVEVRLVEQRQRRLARRARRDLEAPRAQGRSPAARTSRSRRRSPGSGRRS